MKKVNLSVIIVILIFAMVFAYFEFGVNYSCTSCTYDSKPVNTSFTNKLIIPNQEFSSVKIGAASNFPDNVNESELMYQGKPEILFVSADYCPYCAAERWALIIALDRFGNFTNLHYMTSSPSDYAPNTPTFTFYNSTYYSPYISFVSVETETNKLSGNGYAPLQNLTSGQQKIMSKYNSGGSIPFTDFANQSILIGSNYDPIIIAGKNWTDVSAALNSQNSTIAQNIIGSANLITARICEIDNNQPENVCNQNYIQQIKTFA
jgi:thiol-disulfide isomerase/thioredoxin